MKPLEPMSNVELLAEFETLSSKPFSERTSEEKFYFEVVKARILSLMIPNDNETIGTLTEVEPPEGIRVIIASPSFEEASELTQEDVWGKFENGEKISNGMIVARSGDICPYFEDEVPYKSVTVVCDKDQYHQVGYWLEYVHGANSISDRMELEDNKMAIRSDYKCW